MVLPWQRSRPPGRPRTWGGDLRRRRRGRCWHVSPVGPGLLLAMPSRPLQRRQDPGDRSASPSLGSVSWGHLQPLFLTARENDEM